MTSAPTPERGPQCRLLTLGQLTLLTPRGEDEDLAKRRRKLALLTILALSPRPLSRDTLVDMFWGEESEQRARHSLSDALSHLRRVIGKEAISARQADIELSPDARLAVDAREFSDACRAQDWSRAIALYHGPFLDGVIIDRSARFDQWCAQVRERLERLFAGACAARSAELARLGDWAATADVAERWLDCAPDSADAARSLIEARAAAGTPAALREALAAYDRVVRRLSDEHGATPEKAVNELAVAIRARLAALSVASPVPDELPTPTAPQPSAPAPSPTNVVPATSRSRWRRRVVAGVMVVAAASAIVWPAALVRARVRGDGTPSAARPALVVTNIRNTLGDTNAAWLGEGLRQMLAAGLDRGGRFAVVPPVRVRDALARRGDAAASLGEAEELELARTLGATWRVGGGITRGDGVYVLDITVSETSTGKSVGTFSVTGQSLIGVADQAVRRIRSLAAVNAGPYFAEVETSSEEAFQDFIRAQQANAEGRYTEGARALDAAIAADSSFPSAIMERLRLERGNPRSALLPRLVALYDRAKDRMSDWDRLEQAAYYAFHNGEHGRAERLAASLVERYPLDPRAYRLQADVLVHHGKWSAADSIYSRLLAIDSLAITSGGGACVPCEAFSGLVNVRVIDGDLAGAERAARRWVALQPDLPKAWSDLATVLSFAGQFDSALEADRRAVALSNGEREFEIRSARLFVMSRRYDEADSAIAKLEAKGGDIREEAAALRVSLLRERAQHRAALAVMATMRPASAIADLVGAQTQALLGHPEIAVQRYESFVRRSRDTEPPSPITSVSGDMARGMSWFLALEADAIWVTADTVRLRAVADTLQRVSQRSYYGRDWGLSHHVRGLIAIRGGHYQEAMRELLQARWGVSGWTRTLAAFADAARAAGRPADALPVLRDAYKGPMDAMGHYLPRSEIDFRMAESFIDLGVRDSAQIYMMRMREAWRRADPEWKQRLQRLESEYTRRF